MGAVTGSNRDEALKAMLDIFYLIEQGRRSNMPSEANERGQRQMSKFKRPSGMDGRNDAEKQYRAGFQHGAQAVRKLLEEGKLDPMKLIKWIEIDLQRWRYDEMAEPAPPKY